MTLRTAPAFRDFGGHAVDGGRVRRGVLYRSEVLAGLDADDRAYVDRLALRLVCDLRNVKERERTPCLDWLVPAPERLLFDVTSAFRPTAKLSLDRLLSDTSAEAARELMIVTYESIPAAAAPHLRELMTRLAAGDVPALIHCSAGKDRTGFFCAIVLAALGVDRETIYADYLQETPQMRRSRAARTGVMMQALIGAPVSTGAIDVLSGVDRLYLDASFDAIEREFGGLSTYLRDAAGLDGPMQQALRARLVERT